MPEFFVILWTYRKLRKSKDPLGTLLKLNSLETYGLAALVAVVIAGVRWLLM